MAVTLERRLTEAEYLELERAGEVRHEFVNGRMLEMEPESHVHSRIKLNIVVAVAPVAHERKHRVSLGGAHLRTLQGLRYPDIMICCLPSTDDYIESDPCFLLEVLSPSTEAKDRGQKFNEYTSIPSLTQYVLVAQDEQRVTVFTRGTDDWRVQSFTSGAIQVQCLETPLALEQIYAGVEFAAEELTPADSSAP